MPDVLVPLNLNKNELQNARIQNLATAPGSPVEGQVYVDTTMDPPRARIFLDGEWTDLANLDDVGAAGIPGTTFDAKGDLLVGTADDTFARLPVGADGTLAFAASGETTGFEYRVIEDSDIPAAIARDSEVTAAVSAHEGAGDPHGGYQLESEKGQANGYASLDGSGDVPDAQIPDTIARDSEVAAGYQPLDSDLTSIAALTTTAFGRSFLELADADAAQTLVDTYSTSEIDDLVTASTEAKAWKDPVVAATTAAGTLASDFENGDAIDGVTLATGDRILVKNQASADENGIYVVNATGAPTRADDANTGAEISNATVLVTEGTANQGDTFTAGTVATIDSDPVTFVKTSEGNTVYTADEDTLTLTGTEFSINAGGVDTAELAADAVDGTKIADNAIGNEHLEDDAVGTNEIQDGSVTDVKLASTFIKKFAQDIGNGSDTSIAVTHSLGTRDVKVEVYRNSTPWDTVLVDVQRNSISQVTLIFAVAPTSAQFRVVVEG